MTETEPNTEALATVEPADLAPATTTLLPAQRMTLQQIAVARPQAMDAFVEAMASAARNLRRAAFALADPEDFVLSRDGEGNETAMLAGPGAQKIAPLLGIAITNLRGPDGQPVSEPVYENGTAVIIGDIESRVLGTVLESVRAERDEAEGFTGRKGNKGDLKSAANTLLLSKGVRTMLGMSRIPLAVLKENGIDVARCRKGHGYRGGARYEQPVAAPVARQAVPAAAPSAEWVRPEPPAVEPVPQDGPPEDRADVPVIPFGKNKGTPIDRLSDRSLQWYIEAAEQNINDPAKARYRDKEAVWLTQLTREMARRNV